MKFASTVTLGVALAVGLGAVVPASAQDERQDRRSRREQRERAASYTPAVRDAAAAAQTAIGAQDYATARAKVNEASAAAVSGDDKYLVNSLLYDIARGTNDSALQGTALDGMIASGKVQADRLAQFYTVRSSLAYQARDYARAESAAKGGMDAGGNDPNLIAILIDAQAKNNKPAEAVATFLARRNAELQAGRQLSPDWYGRAMNIAIQARLAPQLGEISQGWLTAYPTPDNWRDTIISYRDLTRPDADHELDLMRLLRTVNGLKGERDYYEYAEQVYLKYPGEAKAVIDEGVRAGAIQLTAGSNMQSFSQTANSRIAADRADLPSAAASAARAADGRSALSTANAYLGYADWAKAIELYRLALQKGNVDANLVNTRLGMALARSGDAAGARTAFAAVTGPRQQLARYWIVWLDNQNRPAAAPAAAAAPAQPAS